MKILAITLIYLIGAAITAIIYFRRCCKIYPNSIEGMLKNQSFDYWFERNHKSDLFMFSIFWYICLPLIALKYLCEYIADKMKKHYNIE